MDVPAPITEAIISASRHDPIRVRSRSSSNLMKTKLQAPAGGSQVILQSASNEATLIYRYRTVNDRDSVTLDEKGNIKDM